MAGRIVALALALGLAAPGAGAEGVAEVAACLARNLPRDAARQEVLFVSRDRAGSERQIRAEVVWKRFEGDRVRVRARVEAPEDLRDSAVLWIQRDDGGADLFAWLPELKKTRRIQTASLGGSLFGSDFTYEDFQQLHGMALAGATQLLPQAELEGTPVWVVERRPAAEAGSVYERVVTFVERERCLLLRAEMWEPGGRLRKVLSVDAEAPFEQDGVRVPRRVLLEDQRRGTTTRLELLELDLAHAVRRADLTPTALER
jgi:hypothetical protein